MTDTAIAVATERDVVTVAGPDATTFLQGQLSQDLDALAVATTTFTFVLQPQGKVDAWARLTKTAADEFLLDIDAGHGAALGERLRRFLIRTKAEIEVTTRPLVAVRGVSAPRPDVPGSVLRLRAPGPDAHGYDLLGDDATAPDGVQDGTIADLERLRIRSGVPAMGAELTDATIPAEVGDWIIDHSVSFTKGCFVGQELTARIDSRGGNVPRRLRALVVDGPAAVGDEVRADAPCGPVTSAASDPDLGTVALAYCGRAVEPGAVVRVGDADAVVHELPLD